MVNTGRPSTGCHACRKRKIKCDEGKPQCRRCIAIGADCPGYRQQIDVFFREKNVLTKDALRRRSATKTQKPLAPKPIAPLTPPEERPLVLLKRSPSPIIDFDDRNEDVVEIIRDTIEVPVAPRFDISEYAVARFYSDYVLSKDLIPFLAFLPKLFDKPRRDYCLMQALPAVALASMARQNRDHTLMFEAHRRYARGCTALSAAITDPSRVKSDEVFVAVFLLGLYELITGERVTTGVWDAHSSGREALMHLRGRSQLRSLMGRNMYMLMHKQMLINSFIGREAPKDKFESWFPPATQSKSTIVIQWEYTMHMIARFHANAAQSLDRMKRSGAYDQDRLVSYILEGIERDRLLVERARSMPKPWEAPKQHYARHWAEQTLNPDDPDYARIHAECAEEDKNFYCPMTPVFSGSKFRSVRLHILQILHELSEVVQPSEALNILGLQSTWKAEATQTVSEICASVPRYLGPLGPDGLPSTRAAHGSSLRGYMLLWSLRVSITSIGASSDQRAWIATILEYIGGELGIGQATGIAQLMPHVMPYRGPRNIVPAPIEIPEMRRDFGVFGVGV